MTTATEYNFAQGYWELLDNPPTECQAVAQLIGWAQNYDYKDGNPYQYFLDTIGYSTREFGTKLAPTFFELDGVSLPMFKDALEEWLWNSHLVELYIDALEVAPQ